MAIITLPQPRTTLIDRVVGWFDPQAGLRRHHARQLLTRAYEAASPLSGGKPKRSGASANADHSADAATLRANARALKQNVPIIRAGLEARAAAMIGTGIVTKFEGPYADTLQTLWARWLRECDADGLRDLYGIQSGAFEAMDCDGEVLVRLRPRLPTDGLAVPLQLQLLEIDWLDSLRNEARGPNTIVNGKEYDPIGRLVAYWLYPQHPGEIGRFRASARGMSSPVPADQIIHLFHPDRPGAGRGITRLAPIIAKVKDLALLEDAELARKNLESRLSVIASGEVDSLVQQDASSSTPGDLGSLPGGGIVRVPPGLNLTTVAPNAVPGFEGYCKWIVHQVCAGGGWTYEQATGDVSEANFSSARVSLQNQRREIDRIRWITLIPQLIDGICAAFVRTAVLAGKVPRNAVAVTTYTHTPPKWEYVNPKDEVDTVLAEIAGGLNSISGAIRARGDDPEKIFDELEADVKNLQARGIWDALVFLLKGRMPTESTSTGALLAPTKKATK